MFDSLSDRLGGVFDKLRGRGALNEEDVRDAMREVRIALLEADVALPVVRDFVDKVTEQAVGQIGAALGHAGPAGRQDRQRRAGRDARRRRCRRSRPRRRRRRRSIMMVGLQGSGKTTTTAKIAQAACKEQQRQEGADGVARRQSPGRAGAARGARRRRPRSRRCRSSQGQQPVDIATRALQAAKLQGFDVLMLDTAGRLHVDQALMDEMKAVADVAKPHEILLVVDALTGQDAVNVAKSFSEQVPLTGVVLTRMDGDARGGAALSMRAVTGKPIKFAGTGEKLDGLEPFHPVARRRPHPRHGRRRHPGREARRRAIKAGGCREARRAHGQGPVRPERPARPAAARCSKMGGLGALAGDAARHRRRRRTAMANRAGRRQGADAHGRDHRLDDAQGARQARTAQRQAQDPRRQGLGHARCRTSTSS